MIFDDREIKYEIRALRDEIKYLKDRDSRLHAKYDRLMNHLGLKEEKVPSYIELININNLEKRK